MIDLFGVRWSDLEVGHVESFLASADDEGINWEAKADHDRSSLSPGSVQKAGCGLANQIGGYILIGAARSEAGEWRFPGISPPHSEPDLWIGQVMRSLRPVPNFETKTWDRSDGLVAAVVKVDPVAVPPCMTPSGVVYQRVPLETLPIRDPELIHRLFQQGRERRDLAYERSIEAAYRALVLPGWYRQRCIGISVALSPIGRETDDISSRLFVPETRQATVQATWDLHSKLREQGQPDGVDQRQRQDSHATVLEYAENRVWGIDEEVVATHRSCWATQANWDGSVAASLTVSDADLEDLPQPEEIIEAMWEVVVPLAECLSGFGPTQLVARVAVTKSPDPTVEGAAVHAPGRVPPTGSMYARLPGLTTMGRLVDADRVDRAVVESLGRELRRASGAIQDEPST